MNDEMIEKVKGWTIVMLGKSLSIVRIGVSLYP
jgi:hypothetical protein